MKTLQKQKETFPTRDIFLWNEKKILEENSTELTLLKKERERRRKKSIFCVYHPSEV